MMRDRRNVDALPGEAQAIEAFMARLADVPVEPRLPPASLLWTKAQLLRRWDVEQQLTLTSDVLEPVQIAASLATAAALLLWVLPSLARGLFRAW